MPDYAETGSQPAPAGNGPSVTDAVIADLHIRRGQGTKKYGTELRAGNGRDALVDAYQEALDLCLYLRQALMDREASRQSFLNWLR